MEKLVSFAKKLAWLYVGIMVINLISSQFPILNSIMVDPLNAFKR